MTVAYTKSPCRTLRIALHASMNRQRTIFVGPRVVGYSLVLQGNVEEISDERKRFGTRGQRAPCPQLAFGHDINRHRAPERDEGGKRRRQQHWRVRDFSF